MHVWLTPRERVLFDAFVPRAKSYFEYGMGGSTVFASKVVSGPVHAIESDREWIEKIRDQISADDSYPRVLTHVGIGPTGEWGYPLDQSFRNDFPSYHEAVHRTNTAFDLYFVDGRFRVACCCQVFRHMRADSILAVHDYRSRPQYHAVETMFRIIAEVEDLTFFVRRTDADSKTSEKLLDVYRYETG